ncbi:Phosphodiesterase, MJ0936 family [Desulfonema limicola]|uniref:Phosphoesterase n=1 Tax=Desulfonema limicola TaxID=45656 RepID=A0A975GJ10_9BACT|nr:metallophosphoesterase family protein [Desulfonema limicola]QTA82934.1 Phosphodiesterase, MJ0936 family [Desulfonema limicola]
MTKIKDKDKYLIAVISDTHGLLRPSVFDAFKGADMILHAGDVCGTSIIDELLKIAPVTAVRGNMDGGKWAEQLPGTEVVEAGGILIYMLHDLNKIDLDPETAGFNVVISGHTHQPAIINKDNVLYLNPGSAGPRRFDYPVSAALLEIHGKSLNPRIIELAP